ncbi:enterochelin esterase domain-containing protein, partial [Corynebacterium bovis]|uniref:enterochelin esterase domain-containing protein n=1 Tax=Corynebacterium bovis TaxID=36808 RepID=UPI003138B508
MTGPLPVTGSPGTPGCMSAAAITAQLTHADAAAVERFWTHVRTLGTPVDATVPLIAPDTGTGQDTGSTAGTGRDTGSTAGDTCAAATMQVTFLWRQERSATCDRVYLRVNRVTDKGREALGLMHHIPGTDVWALTLDLAPTTRLSYGFVPLPPGTE